MKNLHGFTLLKNALGLCLPLLLSGSVLAQVDEPVTYAGIQAGVHNLEDWDARVNLGPALSLPGELELEEQFEAGFFIGREYERARYELEYQRGSFDIVNVRLGLIDRAINADGNYQAVTLNAYRARELSEDFNGYLGLGIGWGRVDLPDIDLGNNCNCMNADADNEFVYQGRIGIEYEAGDQHNLFLQYTWLKMQGPRSAGSSPGVKYSDKGIGIVAAGYRYRFE